MSPASPETDRVTEDEISRLRLALFRLVRNIRSNSVGDISPSQLAVLSSLHRHGPSTIGQLAEYEHVQPPSASRIVSALEQRGFVERSVDPTDRRCTPIALTAVGRHYLAQARVAGMHWLADHVDQLGAADVGTLRGAIPVLERLLEEVE